MSSLTVLSQPRNQESFNNNWKFFLGDDSLASLNEYNDSRWRLLQLPHDWSIEHAFDTAYATTTNQAALPAGIGWYRKHFTVHDNQRHKNLYIHFDGVYRNSTVYVNGAPVGFRPNGYSGFRYDITPFVRYGQDNVIAVRVDNSQQPSSRWYTGSGIYRNVYLVTTSHAAFDLWGIQVTTPKVSRRSATVAVKTTIHYSGNPLTKLRLQAMLTDSRGRVVATGTKEEIFIGKSKGNIGLRLTVNRPQLWSPDSAHLYTLRTRVMQGKALMDEAETRVGIRSFYFDAAKGFFLNGQHVKIKGVCEHHDLGALGAAVNVSAIKRRLQILKDMGVNAIRTAHNPPAPELLNLCDQMGFLVMDEAFDMWRKRKNKFDYHLEFDEWHQRDLADMVRRDRNHPSIIAWSIGNEIREQFDSSGIALTRQLVDIVKQHDTTRPVTCALTENEPGKNFIYQSGALDILGFNYKLNDYPLLPERFTGKALLATETASALATRGHYRLPADSVHLLPASSKLKYADTSNGLHISAYDNSYAYWGSSHEAGWLAVKKYPFMAGIFVWSGFDFLGEPVPFPWPARSSYYGVIDLAGFPKDTYYMYQSEWSDKPVLHVLPHWNWAPGDTVDVWAYYNNADEVELLLNDRSLGIRHKADTTAHVAWKVPFEPGTLKAISRKNGNVVLTKEVNTAGLPAAIRLTADRLTIAAGGNDLAFVTAEVVDKNGNIVPGATNQVYFTVSGPGQVIATDNGSPVSHEPFQSGKRLAFNGKCLAMVKATGSKGNVVLAAASPGLNHAEISIIIQ